jgi:hypothetical protein
MVHSCQDEICLLVDGMIRRVTDQALGSWLRRLPELSIVKRSLEDPLVLFTCTASATRQQLADRIGRLVWFPEGMTTVGAEPIDPEDRAAGDRVVVGVHATGDGRGGRFRSVYPQGPAGDRVRWAYRRRFASHAMDWLVERSADAGSTAPEHARALLFGRGGFRGLSYFDRRDRASRAAVLGSSVFGSTYVAWTPKHAYQPGVPAEGAPATGTASAAARPWDRRELGELPFDPDAAVVVVGYFADGRFAVYDELRDVSYWETPPAFGRRLGKDLAAAEATGSARGGKPLRVLLLTDFEAVPDGVRADVARGLGGAELITVNAPSSLFLDESPGRGGPKTRIALLPGAGGVGVGVPEWTSTTSAGVSITLYPAPVRLTGEMQPAHAAHLPRPIPGVQLYPEHVTDDQRYAVLAREHERRAGINVIDISVTLGAANPPPSPFDADAPVAGRSAGAMIDPRDAGEPARSPALGTNIPSGPSRRQRTHEYEKPSRRPSPYSWEIHPDTALRSANGLAEPPPGPEHSGALMRGATRWWVRRRGAVPTWAELESLAYQTVVRTAAHGHGDRLGAAPGREVGRCIALALTWRDTLFPDGIAATATTDDLVTGRKGLLAGLVAADGWVRVEAPEQVEAALASAHGALYAMVVWEPAGQVAGHATVWHAHRVGPAVRWMDLEVGQGRWMRPGGPPGFATGHARAVFVSTEARVLDPPAATPAGPADLRALLELAPARPVTGGHKHKHKSKDKGKSKDKDKSKDDGEGEGHCPKVKAVLAVYAPFVRR